jgi:hypothetical protein
MGDKMRVFEHPNTESWKGCPICGKRDDKPVTLIGINGTEDGNIMEAEQFHLDCIELRYYPNKKVIGMGL